MFFLLKHCVFCSSSFFLFSNTVLGGHRTELDELATCSEVSPILKWTLKNSGVLSHTLSQKTVFSGGLTTTSNRETKLATGIGKQTDKLRSVQYIFKIWRTLAILTHCAHGGHHTATAAHCYVQFIYCMSGH